MPRPAHRRLARAACLAAVAVAALPAPAPAIISGPTVVDGPGADVLGLDGVAMAPDGTGGLVYRKRVAGRTNVFVARFADGAWTPAQRVDVGQRFSSSWPAIAAGNGGRLVVTWIHEFGGGVQNRLYSALLGPGATRFQAPTLVDPDVREGVDASPSISMNAGGTAYLAYRVVLNAGDPSLPPGTVDADVRLARLNGQFWSQLGQPADRVQAQPVLAPTPFNGPRVVTTVDGNAVVAWQEPDDGFVPRVYARRIFGQVLGTVLPVSPIATPEGQAITAVPDQLALDVAPFGQAAVALRMVPGSQDPFTRPRAYVAVLPSSFSPRGGAFLQPVPVDGGGADGPLAALGPAAVTVDDQGAVDVAVGLDAAAFAVPVTEASATVAPAPLASPEGAAETTVGAPVRLDDGTSAVGPEAVLQRAQDGALAVAWITGGGGAGGVALLERRADGTPTTRTISAPAGGVVTALRLDGSRLGDALVAFTQGTGAGTQVVAASIDAPPSSFNVATPPDWTRQRRLVLSWDPAPHAIGGVRYDLQVDGEDVATGVLGTSARAPDSAADDGRHDVQVVATDTAGQVTTSVSATLLVDRTAPRVVVRVRGRRVEVRVTDGARNQVSGTTRSTTAWGDGRRSSTPSASHRYARAGRYRLVVRTADEAGNQRTVRRTVVVR